LLDQDIAKASTDWNAYGKVDEEAVTNACLEPTSCVETVDTATVGDAVGRAGDIDWAGRGLELDVVSRGAHEVEGEDNDPTSWDPEDKGA
jgi:hypothetical protein